MKWSSSESYVPVSVVCLRIALTPSVALFPRCFALSICMQFVPCACQRPGCWSNLRLWLQVLFIFSLRFNLPPEAFSTIASHAATMGGQVSSMARGLTRRTPRAGTLEEGRVPLAGGTSGSCLSDLGRTFSLMLSRPGPNQV